MGKWIFIKHDQTTLQPTQVFHHDLVMRCKRTLTVTKKINKPLDAPNPHRQKKGKNTQFLATTQEWIYSSWKGKNLFFVFFGACAGLATLTLLNIDTHQKKQARKQNFIKPVFTVTSSIASIGLRHCDSNCLLAARSCTFGFHKPVQKWNLSLLLLWIYWQGSAT